MIERPISRLDIVNQLFNICRRVLFSIDKRLTTTRRCQSSKFSRFYRSGPRPKELGRSTRVSAYTGRFNKVIYELCTVPPRRSVSSSLFSVHYETTPCRNLYTRICLAVYRFRRNEIIFRNHCWLFCIRINAFSTFVCVLTFPFFCCYSFRLLCLSLKVLVTGFILRGNI